MIIKEAKAHKILHGEGLGSASYRKDFFSVCKSTGCLDPRELERREIEITASESFLSLKIL